MEAKRGVIGILTGGGDVPGLNPAIRAITVRAAREGFRVVGIRNGWEGLVRIDRDRKIDEQEHCQVLTQEIVNKVGRTGGTFLHTSRTRPSHIARKDVPQPLRGQYASDMNDLTPEVLKNLEYLGIDYLVPIGGDDTLSYGVELHNKGVKVVALPKTMDNDVPGTDYCIGFSTCVTRTIELSHRLRTTAGSHERFLVIEVFGRYAGFTALLPTLAGAANRCVIPECKFDIEKLTELLVRDRRDNPSRYSVALVSEGATFEGGEMVFEGDEADAYGHKKLGGIGDAVSNQVKELSGRFNNGKKIGVINQRLGYLVRCGDPDALDSIVPVTFSNIAMDLILNGKSGRLVSLRKGKYDHVALNEVTSRKKVVDIDRFYNCDRLRPEYQNFNGLPMFIMTSED
ncbi:MAG: ATP-dependent 6-phosphofructokinase [Nitrospinae bacterium]|nr:ATP-dependent 6-phosphofructokinase [Nitrospinota bacterium]